MFVSSIAWGVFSFYSRRPDDTALVSCDRNTIDAHRQFISFQLASCRWRPRVRKLRLGLLFRQCSHHVWRDVCCLKEYILSVRACLAPFKVSEVAKFTPSYQPKTFSPFQEWFDRQCRAFQPSPLSGTPWSVEQQNQTWEPRLSQTGLGSL